MKALYRLLTQPTYALTTIGSSVLFFDVYFLLMRNLPGSANHQCIPGGNLTAGNLVFAAFISICSGVIIAALIFLFNERRRAMGTALFSSGTGLIVGSLSVFCTACTLPIIGFFGASTFFIFIAEHSDILKAISVVLMAFAVYRVAQLLNKSCGCS